MACRPRHGEHLRRRQRVTCTVVSGRPAANGGSVRREELRIDSVDDPTVRMAVESGLLPRVATGHRP